MDVLICIPDEKIPKNNGNMNVDINFCGGHVCQVISIDGQEEESLCFEEEKDNITSHIIVYYKNANILRQPLCLNYVEEYYCTEKMFFARRSDGASTYVNLDEISKIDICKEED